MVKRVYLTKAEPSNLMAQYPAHMADAVYDSMVAAQVNICDICHVIQDDPSYGGELIPWSPDGDNICKECWEPYQHSYEYCPG